MREIHIKPVLNGFIVTVGCGVVVFTSIDALCEELRRYHSAPEQVEKEYQKAAINKSCTIEAGVDMEPCRELRAEGRPETARETVPPGRTNR